MLNAIALQGQVDRSFPVAPGTPVIHFKPETLDSGGLATWENSGSGGSTYNGTFYDDASPGTITKGENRCGLPTAYFEYSGVSESLRLNTAYSLPSACIVAALVKRNRAGHARYLMGHTTGSSRIFHWDPGYLNVGIINTAGVSMETAEIGGDSSGWRKIIFERTSATAGTFYVDGTPNSLLTSLSGTFTFNQLPIDIYSTLAELLIYPSLATSVAQIEDYLDQKFSL